jgi:transmembrane sensor
MEWPEEKDAVRIRMLAHINEQTTTRTRRLWTRIAAAASILIAVSIGSYYILHKKPAPELAQNQKQDIAPGKNQATLTLANGKKIILTKSLNGLLAQQGNMNIRMGAAGITYKGTGNNQIQYNTLSTARGEVTALPLMLADGTKAWLNAGSSITYPVSFTHERKVAITGEVDFEVVHNAAKPFTVTARDQTLQDIGTTFDINAYTDEPAIKTTLIEGSVKVSSNNLSIILKPGQQSKLTDSKFSVNDADIQETIAWKTGMFHFTDEKLAEIMLQVSRWYDVDVVYDDVTLKDKTFGVIGNRFANVSKLLHSLELTGEVKFKVEGKKITVFKP